jgi:hypothetical protein
MPPIDAHYYLDINFARVTIQVTSALCMAGALPIDGSSLLRARRDFRFAIITKEVH